MATNLHDISYIAKAQSKFRNFVGTMITEKERQFIHYWEQAREQRKGFANRVFSGLPMAFLFFMPILLSLLTIYFFSLIGSPRYPMCLPMFTSRYLWRY